VTASLSVLVWLAPAFSESVITGFPKRGSSVSELDPGVSNKVRQRLWTVYDKREKIQKKYYASSATRLSSVMFSSDGWAVAAAANFREGDERMLEAVDYRGIAVDVLRAVKDPIANVVYLKLAGADFPFINFAPPNSLARGNVLWQAGENERSVKLDILSTVSVKSFDISKPHVWFTLPAEFAAGSIFVNERGELSGVADNQGRFIPVWLIQEQYVPILSLGSVKYTGLPLSGFFVEGTVEDEGAFRRAAGFYVTRSPAKSSSSTIGIGDVIVAVSDSAVTLETIARQILTAPDPAMVTVIRGGKEVEVRMRKTRIE